MNHYNRHDLAVVGNLPLEVRKEVDQWRRHLLAVQKPGIIKQLESVARAMGVSFKTARHKYYLFINSGCDIRTLINKAKVPEKGSVLTPEFLDWFQALAESNQRSTKAAHRKFLRLWADGVVIPGIDNSLPRHERPPGTEYSNITKKIKDAFATAAMRRGLSHAVAKHGPKIFSTRANLYYGSHLMIDDLWHDNFVVFGKQIVRVLELDALDVFSGYLVTFGTKPRYQRDDGTFDNLKEKFARMIVASVFFNEGYSDRGTTILGEHGTAKVSDAMARILYDRSCGAIKLRESGITGEEQAVLGQRGQGKGNPRFKAALESIRNLKHNELAALPAQTGKDVEHRPEQTHGQLVECAEMLKVMAVLAQKNPVRARQLRLNLLDYHADFLPLLMDVYRGINARTDHNLEGWHAAGNMAIEYRVAPDAERWLTDADFGALPESSKMILLDAAKSDPRFIRSRKMSPAEVRSRDAGSLIKLPAFVVGELLGEDYARELEVRGAYFNTFSDIELAPEPLRFESIITTPEGGREQLRDGKYLVFINPFDLSKIFIHDVRQTCLGTARRVTNIDRADDEQLKHAFGYRATRIAELKRPLLARHAQTVRDETARLAHNHRTILGAVEDVSEAEQLAKSALG